jgi:formiminotetrahydrofolate cyclodeaminase
MVVGFSLSKKELSEFHPQLQELQEKFKTARMELQSVIQKDSDSYAAVESTRKMPKSSDEEKQRRQAEMQRALQAAALAPIEVAERSAVLLPLFRQLSPISNPNLKSDLETGIAMAQAAIRGALANVAINLTSIKDEAFSDALKRRVREVEKISVC